MLASALAVIVTFGLVIFLHESGHFLLCKVLHVRVDQFAFGFGPELFGITRGETRFSVCALPLGGFVKPAGENLEECTGAPAEYFSKPWHQRFLIVAAGPAMNYILAFALFAGVVYAVGEPRYSDQPVVGGVVEGYPAQKAGLRENDRILDVNGIKTRTWKELAEKIHKNPRRPVTLRLKRTSEPRPFSVTLTPAADPESGIGLIGISPQVDYRRVGLWKAGREGLRQCWYWTAKTVTTLAAKIYKRERPDLAGPVGIVGMVSQAAHSGLKDLVFFIAIISLSVGFLNLIPIPLLDGGHAAFYLWEGLSGRKITRKALHIANSIGLAILLTILVFATYSDILRLHDQNNPPSMPQRSTSKTPSK